MRTTVTLNDDVYEAVRAPTQTTSRFLAFEVPAGARRIPASRIQMALDEDGIV